jgi:ABC-type sugar transport system substrate-binding protein
LICLFGDARMPFQRAQAQYVHWRDAADPLVVAETWDAGGSVKQQAAQLQQLIASPPQVLFLQPLATSPQVEQLTQLRSAGCRIVVFDPPPGTDWSKVADWVLVSDPESLGRQAAEAAVEALQKRARPSPDPGPLGRLVELRGADESAFSEAVHSGFSAALAAQPHTPLVHDAPTDWDPAKAKLRFAEAHRLQAPFQVVFAHDDFLAQAVHQAAVELGIRDDLLIIGVNAFHGAEGGLEMLRRQEIDATFLRPFQLDHIWSEATQAAAPSPPLPRVLRFRARLVRPADLDEPGPLLALPPES